MRFDRGARSRSTARDWLVRPLSVVYGVGAAWRRRHATRPGARRRLTRPVISVGNLTVGGAGKTPVVAMLAQWLSSRGERPAVLSRGYGRQNPSADVVVVRDAERVRAGLAEAGDEPLMLARALPGCAVLVARERYRAGLVAESLGCTVHLLDDGFQHMSLWRDVDVVLVSEDDLTRERVLPAGRLREPAGAAAVADAWLTEPRDIEAVASLATRAGVSHVFTVHRRLGASYAVGHHVLVPESRGPSVLLVSGVARPDRLARDVAQQWEIVDHLVFADHHPYTPRDVRAIAARAVERGVSAVLTTEKDAVRLEPLAPFPFALRAVPLTITIEPEAAFSDWLSSRLAEARSARA